MPGLVTRAPFYRLGETGNLLDHGLRQRVLICLSQTLLLFLLNFPSEASALIWSWTLLAVAITWQIFFFSLLCITSELSLESSWFFWVTGLDEKHLNRRKVKTTKNKNPNPHLQIFWNSRGCSDSPGAVAGCCQSLQFSYSHKEKVDAQIIKLEHVL